jgi:cyclic-di-GMP phosphodiesterase TipF (flagellum assembly factor)
MLAVSLAAAVAANLHVGLELELAAAFGLTLFSLLLLVHVLSRRRTAREEPRLGEAAPGHERVQSLPPALPLDPNAPAAPHRPGPTQASSSNIAQPRVETRNSGETVPPGSPPQMRSDPFAPIWPYAEAGLGAAYGSDVPGDAHQIPLPAEAALHSAAWDFRPGDKRPAQPLQRSSPGGRSAESAQDESAAIDQILKRLAAQIQSGTQQAARTEFAGNDRISAEAEQAAALASAVDSLKSAANVMRHGEAAAPAEAALGPAVAGGWARAAAAGPATPAQDRLAAVAEALARESVDVFLEPILGLADERAKHFEVIVRLKNAAGEAFDHDDVVHVGRGAGLLPLLDALRVRHSAGFALRLERRGRDGKVFSNVTSESLESRQFLSGVAERHGQGELTPDRLVLSFEQRVVRAFAPAQRNALNELRDIGFRFSLQSLTDLDMDFGALKASGFEFVKLDAGVFLQGLPLGQDVVPASDLCRHLASLGLAVIVGRIESEAERARVQGFGVQFGQGGLFGAPRPVNLGIGGAVAAA